MYDKFFVGLDLTSAEDNGLQRPISRVTLLLDDENAVTAGDDTGLELSASCPHATQAMVNAILDQVKGYQYRMLQADDANLDPAAELGDGITAGGMYSVISRINDDGSGYSGVTAPGESEMEDEFPSAGPMTKEFQRKIAQTRAQILKTAESIILRIEGDEESIQATLDLIDGFTVTDSSGTTKIKGSSLETGSIAANSISADKLNLTGQITFSDLNSATQSTINSASSNASSALTAANNANNTVSGWVYPGTTMINGQMLMTGTVQASILRGGQVQLLNQYGNPVGTMNVGMSNSGYVTSAVEIVSQSVHLISPNQIKLCIGQDDFDSVVEITERHCSILGTLNVSENIVPNTSARLSIGIPGRVWNDIYLFNDPIITSDRQQKKDISYDLDRYGALFDHLRPVSYKLINGQSGRTHLGLIAQDVEAALGECGLTDMDFAGLIRSPREDGGYDYALRYGEIIAMLIREVQELKRRIS